MNSKAPQRGLNTVIEIRKNADLLIGSKYITLHHMHNEQVIENIKKWMAHTEQRVLDNEEYPMLMLAYKETGNGAQDLVIHRGTEYTDDQVGKILQLFIQLLMAKKPTHG